MRDQRAEVSLSISPERAYESEPVASRDFRILVLGDFGGRGDAAALTNDLPRRVDRDDLDAHIARIAPRLHIAVDDAHVDLAFASLDDFTPDRLAARLTALHRTSTTAPPAEPTTSAFSAHTPPPDIRRTVSGASLLDDMIDDTAGPSAGGAATSPGARSTTRPARTDELSAFVERAVAPHLIRPDHEGAARTAAHTREMTELLRLVLHHPSVQALEATWRALDLLVRRLDTDGALHLFLLDVPREQIATALERLARRRDAANAESWALAVALHAFPDGEAGADALARVAMAAKELDAPVVVSAPNSFAGVESVEQLDDDERTPSPPPEVYALIRRSQEARFLGLTFPRVLLRQPYGRDNPCDTIDFEELDDPERHDQYLWGSGAALVALLVGEAFTERGWAIAGRMALDVGSLPYFTFRRGPETVAKSCAEMIMAERVARHLLSRGLMPVAWIKNTDRVRLVELRSVAEPAAPLAAAWAGTPSGPSA